MDCHYFDLKELLEEACNFIRPLGQIRDIDIESSLPEQVTLNTDRQKLMQVILNLLSNALKYGPENSTVTLNAYVKDQQAIIEVTDQGKGIPPALRSRLFTPFDRLGAERSMTEGTGLGLVLSKQIIDAMGGSIHLADDKSMFWVSVPVAQETAKLTDSHQPSVAPNIQIKGSKQNILYVEDHASNRALIEAIIARHHHLKLHMATNLKDAMNYIHNQSPDILLLDLNLPDGSGELLIQHMQANPAYRSIPIMVLSADALPETILRLQAMGITAYFTKPLDIALFNHQLNQLIIQSNHE
jgi:CheY-like chemotaxis protein